MTAANRGSRDGRVAAIVRPYDCDPRGSFIRRLELPGSAWDEYRDAYVAAFASTVAAFTGTVSK